MRPKLFNQGKCILSVLTITMLCTPLELAQAQEKVMSTKDAVAALKRHLKVEIASGSTAKILQDVKDIEDDLKAYDAYKVKYPDLDNRLAELQKKQEELEANVRSGWDTTDLPFGKDNPEALYKAQLQKTTKELQELKRLQQVAKTGTTLIHGLKSSVEKITLKDLHDYVRTSEVTEDSDLPTKINRKTLKAYEGAADEQANIYQAIAAADQLLQTVQKENSKENLLLAEISDLMQRNGLTYMHIKGIIAALSSDLPENSILAQVCKVRIRAMTASLREQLQKSQEELATENSACSNELGDLLKVMFPESKKTGEISEKVFDTLNPKEKDSKNQAPGHIIQTKGKISNKTPQIELSPEKDE